MTNREQFDYWCTGCVKALKDSGQEITAQDFEQRREFYWVIWDCSRRALVVSLPKMGKRHWFRKDNVSYFDAVKYQKETLDALAAVGVKAI